MGTRGGVSLQLQLQLFQLPLIIQRNHPQCTMWTVLIQLHRCEEKSTERRHFSTKFVYWYVLLKITKKWCLSSMGNFDANLFVTKSSLFRVSIWNEVSERWKSPVPQEPRCLLLWWLWHPPAFHSRQKCIATRKIIPWSLYDLNWKYRREIRIAFNFRYLLLVISTALWHCVFKVCKYFWYRLSS